MYFFLLLISHYYFIVSATPLSRVCEVLRAVQSPKVSLDYIFSVLQQLNPEFDSSNPYENELFTTVYPVLAFLDNSEGAVDIKSVIIIIIMLCQGTTSEKFRAMFEFLQVTNAETLEIEEMVSVNNFMILFQASLALILASHKDLAANDIAETIFDYSSKAVENLSEKYQPAQVLSLNQSTSSMQASGKIIKECISIDSFSDWFRNYGSRYAVWLEFLDLRSTIKVLNEETESTEVDSNCYSSNASVVPQPPSVQGTIDSYNTANTTVLFDLSLSGVNEKLSITDFDVRIVQFLSQKTGLIEMTCDDVKPIFDKYSITGTLSFNAYQSVLADLVNFQILSPDEVENANSYFDRIYEAFDRHSVKSVDIKELFPGFSLLLKGSKSDKLIDGFAINDSNNDKLISRREMWKLLRSYLTVLFALNREKSMKPAQDIYDIIDSISIEITAEMFNAVLDSEVAHDLSFEQFADWYNKIGHTTIAWLELLDINKWPVLDNYQDEVGDDEDEEEEDNNNNNNYNDNNVIFSLAGTNSQLVIAGDSVDLYKHISQACKLSRSTCDELFCVLLQNSSSGLITLNSYHQILGEAYSVDRENRMFLSTLFDRIFNLFDYEQSKTADVLEIASALCLFCSGTKSEKLYSLFKYFDKTGYQQLSYSRLQVFLESLLITINLLTYSRVEEYVSTAVKYIIRKVMKHLNILNNNSDESEEDYTKVLTLEEFGDWYNEGNGSKLIPWLELMNLEKWPYELISEDDYEEDEEYDNNEYRREQQQHEGGNRSGTTTTVFHFPLVPNQSTIDIGRDEVEILQNILQDTLLHKYPVTHLKSVLNNESTSSASIIDRETFEKYVSDLTPRADIQTSSYILLQIYDYLKANSKGYVSVNDLICSLSLFTLSSKTEKLALCFDLYTDKDTDTINERDFIHFLSSFILMLLYISNNNGSNTKELQVFSHIQYICKEVFKYCSNSDSITFQQFADWYNNEGNKDIPWLELLDLRKWPDVEINIDNNTRLSSQQQYASNRPSNQQIYTFILNSNKDQLIILKEDINQLSKFLIDTELYTYGAEDLQDKICKCTNDRNIRKEEYFFYLPEICIKLPESNKEKRNIINYLTRLFYMFDRNDNDIISIFELASAFSLFTKGNKSDKLLAAFDLFNSDVKTGCIPYTELHHYIYSLIAPLLAFNTSYFSEDCITLRKIAENTASEITKSVYESNNKDKEESLSFTDFANWYGYVGLTQAPWLELLDLRKWPIEIEELFEEEGTEVPQDNDEDEEEEEEQNTNIPPAPSSQSSPPKLPPLLPPVPSETPVITCQTTDRNGITYSFTLVAEDAQAHDLILTESGIGENSVDNVKECFQHALGNASTVSVEKFLEIIDQLVPESKGEYLEGVMQQLFKLLAGDNIDELQRCVIESAILPLVKGKKTDKLVYAFSTFTGDINNMVLPSDLFTVYLSSLLAGIIVVKTQPPSFKDITNICQAVIDQILHDIHKPYDSDIDFEEFANWYSEGGFNIIPWLELLDINKWPRYAQENNNINYTYSNNNSGIEYRQSNNNNKNSSILTNDDEDSDEINRSGLSSSSKHSQTDFSQQLRQSIQNNENNNNQEDDNENEEEEEDDDGSDAFILNGTYELDINEHDCLYLKNLLELSKLQRFSPRDIHDTFLGQSEDGKINKQQFDDSLKALIPSSNLSVREQTYLNNALSQLYYVFVTTNENDGKAIPVECISTAISLLSKGNKSSKLSEAFYQYTINDKVSKKDLSQFLYSFLITICMMDEDASKNCKIVIHCRQECDSIVQQIYQQKGLDENTLLTFEDFAGWYSNEGGDSVAPWIELLDLSKWPFPVLSQ